MITKDVVFFRPQDAATSREELYSSVAVQLLADGFVKDSWPAALEERELEFPTGLPVPGGVAIPHTSAEHVSKDAICVVTTQQPLSFHEMGGDEEDLIETRLVIFLVLAEAHGHLKVLSSLIKALQDEAFRTQLTNATERSQVQQLLGERLQLD